jgi:hypothetical protein
MSMMRAAPTMFESPAPVVPCVGVAVVGERDRVLRDRRGVPREPAHLARLRVGLARLDLRDVEDQQVAADVGDVGAVAVVAERHAVREHVALPDRVRLLRVRDVDGGDRLARGAGRIEGLAVRREAALVAEPRDRLGRLQHRVTAVLAHVVDRDQARIGRRVAGDRREQPALRVEVERLVRRHHGNLGQRRGLHGLRRVRHVEHRDALRGRVELERVDGVEQRGVVERALVPAGVDVAQRLEAAGGALVRDQRDVAVQAVGGGARGHAPLDPRLGLGARPALSARGGEERRLGARRDRDLGRLLADPLPEREQVVERRERSDGVQRGQREDDRDDEERSGTAHASADPSAASRALRRLTGWSVRVWASRGAGEGEER